VYRRLEELGCRAEIGLREALGGMDIAFRVARECSAFCVYLMDHAPRDWHDLAMHHDFAADEQMRQQLIAGGIYFFPVATKQCSISYAHTEAQIDRTVEAVAAALESLHAVAG
jgi:glutamate-1-semialdehyde 2,1-aminomutase